MAVRQRQETFAGYSDLTTMCCPTCGVLYAIPERMRSNAERHGNYRHMWHCPNGHELGYGENELEKAERQRDEARNAAAYARSQRDQAESQARAEKAAKTRIRNSRERERKRVQAGVCPCCNRTFKNLGRHMQSQHPDHVHSGPE